MAMGVVERAETGAAAVDAAGADHRNLTLEIDERLEHGFLAAQALPRGERVGAGVDRHLSLAVVSERGRLQHRRPTDAIERRREIRFTANGGEGHDGEAVAGQERLLANAMLGDVQRAAVGANYGVLFGGGGGGRG